MKYMIPYAVLSRDLTDAGLTEDQIESMLRRVLRAVQVDETWYLNKYPDVAEAIAAGRIKSSQQHFVIDGYREGRLPFDHEFDEEWYLRTYPDIAEAAKLGDINSAKQHYVGQGYKEGRLPGDV